MGRPFADPAEYLCLVRVNIADRRQDQWRNVSVAGMKMQTDFFSHSRNKANKENAGKCFEDTLKHTKPNLFATDADVCQAEVQRCDMTESRQPKKKWATSTLTGVKEQVTRQRLTASSRNTDHRYLGGFLLWQTDKHLSGLESERLSNNNTSRWFLVSCTVKKGIECIWCLFLPLLLYLWGKHAIITLFHNCDY